jgi:hypothetical protein
MSSPGSGGSQELGGYRSVTLRLDGSAWQAINEEADREESTVEDLIVFSVLYYLADADSGRISRRISRSPYARALDDRVGSDWRSPALSGRPLTERGRQRAGEDAPG